MTDRVLHIVVPGDLETRTGGYEYDRRIIAGLRALGWTVRVVRVDGGYPFPTAMERAAAAASFASVPDAGLVLADGLAFGALPDESTRERGRLRFIALVHHPLAAETGLDRAAAASLHEGEQRALAAARGVVVTSPRTVDAVEALGVLRARIAVVEPGTAAAPLAIGSGGHRVEMICVASVVPRKGHATLFDALAGLGVLDWHLTCVGSTERDCACAARLHAQLLERGIEHRVTFAGELEGAELEAAWHGADLFVLPTHYEGYGMAVAEALARGIPVVSTPTGGIADLVGARAGVLVPAGDAAALAGALRPLLSDRGARERLRSGALAVRASLPTWDAASRRMEEALVRLGSQ